MKRVQASAVLCLLLLCLWACRTVPEPRESESVPPQDQTPPGEVEPAAPPEPEPEAPQAEPPAPGQGDAKKQIDELRRNPRFYHGEGIAAVESLEKLDEAWTKAEDSALANLSESIEVVVQSIATDILELKGGEAREELSQVVRKYTRPVVLPGVERRRFPDFPERNTVTCVALLDKQVYQDYLKEQLETKRRVTEELIRGAVKARQDRDLLGALGSLADAREQYREMDTPFFGDFDGDGAPELAADFIKRAYGQWLSMVTIRQVSPPDGAPPRFDQHGKLLTPIAVRIEAGPEGSRFPVPGAVLDLETQSGQASRALGTVKSGPDGSVQLPLREVPTEGVREATVKLAWHDAPLFELPRPTCAIPLTRIPLVLRSVCVSSAGRGEYSREIGVKADQIIAANTMDVCGAEESFSALGAEEIEKGRKAQADLICLVCLDLETSEKAGLPLAKATGRFEVYDLLAGKSCISRKLPTFTRYGTSPTAALEAVSRITETMLLDALKQQFDRYVLRSRGDAASLEALEVQQRDRILASVREGLGALQRGDYATALDALLAGQRSREVSGLVWRADVDADGEPEDAAGFVERKLREVVNLIAIEELDKGSRIYSGEGEFIGGPPPSVFAKVVLGTGEVRPVRNLPLRTICVSGEAELSSKIVTDQQGEARLKVSRVDPARAQTVLVVEIDRDISDEIRRPPCRIVLMRVPRFAILVESRDPKLLPVPDQVVNGLAQIVRDRRYEVSGDAAASDYTLKVAFAPDAEYVERLKLQKCEIEVSASLDRQSDGRTLFAIEPLTNRGYGTKPETAATDALAKLLEPLYLEIKKKLVDVKL